MLSVRDVSEIFIAKWHDTWDMLYFFSFVICYYFGYYYSTNFLKTEVQLLFNVVFFSAIQWRDSVISIHISPFSVTLLPPLEVITEPQAELPVLYNSFPLALYFTYGSVHMLMLLFQFVPHFPSPAVSIGHLLCLHLEMYFKIVQKKSVYMCMCVRESKWGRKSKQRSVNYWVC